jgi:hypothetical protein
VKPGLKCDQATKETTFVSNRQWNLIQMNRKCSDSLMFRFSRQVAVCQKNIGDSLNGQWTEVHRERSNNQRGPHRGNRESQSHSAFQRAGKRKILIVDATFVSNADF